MKKAIKEVEVDGLKPVSEEDKLRRRKALLLLRLKGVKLKEAVEQIAQEYGATPASVLFDWQHKDRWLPDIADSINPKTIITEVWATDKVTQDARRSTLYQIDKLIESYRDKDGNLDLSPNSPVLSLFLLKEKYLKALSDGSRSSLENAIRSGILKEQPSRVIVDKRELKGTIDFNRLLGDMNDDEREQFLTKLEAAFEKRDQ